MSHTHHKQKRTYGILVGRVEDGHLDPKAKTPHYEILVKAHHNFYRIAVNVESRTGSDVLVFVNQNFTAKTKLDLPARANGGFGFTPLKTGPRGEGLDYLRDDLFPVGQMKDIPRAGSGVTLKDLLDSFVARAKADPESVILACGESFENPGSDPIFHFSPARGIHDIHMMQGDPVDSNFHDDNRVNGDGAVFFRFSGGQAVALFIKFQTQATRTDNETGDPV